MTLIPGISCTIFIAQQLERNRKTKTFLPKKKRNQKKASMWPFLLFQSIIETKNFILFFLYLKTFLYNRQFCTTKDLQKLQNNKDFNRNLLLALQNFRNLFVFLSKYSQVLVFMFFVSFVSFFFIPFSLFRYRYCIFCCVNIFLVVKNACENVIRTLTLEIE